MPKVVPHVTPHSQHIRPDYDLSNDFFRLWLDPTMTYSCAYFERDDMTLEEAQLAKIDLALGKLGLEPGMTLLDIGCGWGSTMRRAVEKYDVNVIGLTLSEKQLAYNKQKFAEIDSSRFTEVRLQGWEQFNDPVDRIVSLGAFEHFADGNGTYDGYTDFFKVCYNVMPDDGIMLLDTIVVPTADEGEKLRLKTTMSLLRFIKFLLTEIFPGGRLPQVDIVDQCATGAGFYVTRHHRIGENYVRTFDSWANALEAHKDEAIAIQSDEVYERFMHYFTGCRELFRDGYTDVCQFTMEKGLVDHLSAKGFELPSTLHGVNMQASPPVVRLEGGESREVSLDPTPGLGFEVSLQERPSTGYVWELRDSSRLAKLVEDKYEGNTATTHAEGEGTYGGLIMRKFTFQTSPAIVRHDAPNTSELNFELKRPWQEDEPPLSVARIVLRIDPTGGNR